MADLSNKTVAILVDNYFEKAEFTGPMEALKAAGVKVEVVGVKSGEAQSMEHVNLSKTYPVDKAIADVDFDAYDLLVLPGGAINADSLRMNQAARDWVTNFMSQDKPIAAICHAPWLLASAGALTDRKVTSYFTVQDDLRNAGAEWSDQPVVVDDNLITSRQPDDVPAFNQAILEKLAAI